MPTWHAMEHWLWTIRILGEPIYKRLLSSNKNHRCLPSSCLIPYLSFILASTEEERRLPLESHHSSCKKAVVYNLCTVVLTLSHLLFIDWARARNNFMQEQMNHWIGLGKIPKNTGFCRTVFFAWSSWTAVTSFTALWRGEAWGYNVNFC